MKFDDFNNYTRLQKDLEDDVVKDRSKRSMIEIMKALSIKGYYVPVPDVDTDLLEKIKSGYKVGWDELDLFKDNAEYAFILYMLSGWRAPCPNNCFDQWRMFVPLMSTVTYYLACNGVEISEFPKLKKDKLQRLAHFVFDPDSKVIMTKVATATDIFPIHSVKYVHDTADHLPNDLLKHLKQFATVEDVVNEVCRIQMLGPKYKRAEDAKQALLEAWVVAKKV